MISAATPLPCAGSAHLDLLRDELDELVDRVRRAHTSVEPALLHARRTIEDAACAAASLRLDGGLRTSADGAHVERAGTWLDALGERASVADDVSADELATLATLEQQGVAAAIAADDLADAFGRASTDAAGLGGALIMLHGRLTAGLVSDERAGRLRRGPRVVHDASVGRVLFFPTDPALLPEAWDQLLRSVTSGAGAADLRTAPAVRAALLHLELLRHQPFDAANGRLARAAARLALHADGLLPGGLGAADGELANDPLGYHEDVGASSRRRDATRWVERMLEAHVAALIGTLRALHIDLPGDEDALPPALGDTFTLADVSEATGDTTANAVVRCSRWVLGGTATRVVGSSGLRFRRAEALPETAPLGPL